MNKLWKTGWNRVGTGILGLKDLLFLAGFKFFVDDFFTAEVRRAAENIWLFWT